MYNVLVGGAAGDGIDTIVAVFERALKRSGYYVFSVRDFMSRVRGGHNFTQVRFGAEPVMTHRDTLDGMIALSDETVELHAGRLSDQGFILCDVNAATGDKRAVKLNMAGIAKDLGNVKAAGSVAIGAALKFFGEDLKSAEEVLNDTMKKEILDVNRNALKAGFESVEKRFSHIDAGFSQHMLISGNEALALGALAAGLRFYSAYPMSPSTSIMSYLASKKDEAGIVVEQAEDEIAAINMALGASYAGARAMTGTSGGGFSLMVEALGFAGIAEIPIVIADIQRPGPATGFPTRTEQSDLKFAINAAQGEFPRMVIAVRNHTDAFYQTVRAFDIADRYQIPVILLSDQYLADATATIPVFDLGGLPAVPDAASGEGEDGYLRYRLTENGVSPRLIPNKSDAVVAIDSDEHDESGVITESAEVRVQMVDKRFRKLKDLENELQEPEFFGDENGEILLVGFGSIWGAIRDAVTTLNKGGAGGYGALVFGDIWPLPVKEIAKRAAKAKRIVNVEQNATGQLAGVLREKTGIVCGESILKYDGRQLTGEEIVERLLPPQGKEAQA